MPSVATNANPAQITKYPERKTLVATKGRDCSRRLRFTVANNRTIGAALGTIMATIITAHITNISEKSAPLQDLTLPMAMPIDVPISALLWAT